MPEMIRTVRKELPLIFVVDVSKNNNSDEIARLNNFMREIMFLLRDEDYFDSSGEITVGALLFSDQAKWATGSHLVPADEFEWNCVKAEPGEAHIDKAIEELCAKLSRHSLLPNPYGYLAPHIVFVTNGMFSIDDECMKKIEAVSKSSRWYQDSRKIAVIVGQRAVHEDDLARLTGSGEYVIHTNDIDLFRNLMLDVDVDPIEEAIPISISTREEADGVEVHIHGQVKHLDIDDVLSVKKCEVQITAPEQALDPFVDIRCMKRERPARSFNVREGDIWLNTWFPDIDKSLYLEVTNTSDAAVKVHLNSRYYRSNYRDVSYEFSNIEHLIKKTESIELVLQDNVEAGSIVLRKSDKGIQIEDRKENINKLSIDLLPGETCDLEVGDVICNENNETLITFMLDYDAVWGEMSIDLFK